MGKLTGAVVASAKPRLKPYELLDNSPKGLLLRIQPSGVRSYVCQLGRGRRRTIGDAGILTLEQARVTARAWLADLDAGNLPAAARGKSKPMTLGDFIDERYAPWVETERKAGTATVANLKAQFGGMYSRRLDEISPLIIETFKADRLRKGIKPATVNRDLVRIKAALAKAVEWELLDEHPLSKVKRAKGSDDSRVRYLSKAEEKRLRDAMDKREKEMRRARVSGNEFNAKRGRATRRPWKAEEYTDHLRPFVLLAMNTGLRRGEIFSLTWDCVDIQRAMLTVKGASAKSGSTRYMPLNTEAVTVLKQWKKQGKGEGLVFPGVEGARLSNINRSWASLMTLAKLKDFRTHDLRHHFASKLAMGGVDLYTVKELLGHSDASMTQRYAHLAPEHMADAVAKLGAGK